MQFSPRETVAIAMIYSLASEILALLLLVHEVSTGFLVLNSKTRSDHSCSVGQFKVECIVRKRVEKVNASRECLHGKSPLGARTMESPYEMSQSGYKLVNGCASSGRVDTLDRVQIKPTVLSILILIREWLFWDGRARFS